MKYIGTISPEIESILWTRIAWLIILFFGVLSLIAPLIANEKPIYIHDGTNSYWPIFSSVNWANICRKTECEKVMTFIPFSPMTIDVTSVHAPPLSMRKTAAGGCHILGADQLGRDVLAALVHGSRTAVWVSMFAAFMAFIFGLIYGLSIGYYGSDRIRFSMLQLLGFIVLFILFIMLAIFLQNTVYAQFLTKSLGMILFGLMTGVFIFTMNRFMPLLQRKNMRYLDVDALGMRVIDVIKALPPLFIILFALQLYDAPSMWYIIFLIAFLLWAGFARHSRAEVLRLRNTPAVQSALLAGRSDFWIWRNSILPFIVRPLLVLVAFSMASAILLEATLSFLGLGLPAEHISWGTLIDAARSYSSSWWLLVFPGLCMLSLIWALQHLGRVLEEKLRSRQSLHSA